MSWSVTFIGKPEGITKAMEEQSAKLEGQSKVEFDTAKEHINGLLAQNFGSQELIKLSANGHGTTVDGVPQSGRCMVSIEGIYGVILPEEPKAVE